MAKIGYTDSIQKGETIKVISGTLTSGIADEENAYSHIEGGEDGERIKVFNNTAYGSSSSSTSENENEPQAYSTDPLSRSNKTPAQLNTSLAGSSALTPDSEEVYEDIPSHAADLASEPGGIEVSVNVSYEQHVETEEQQEYYSEPAVETAIYTARKARKNGLLTENAIASGTENSPQEETGTPPSKVKQHCGVSARGPQPLPRRYSPQHYHHHAGNAPNAATSQAATAPLNHAGVPTLVSAAGLASQGNKATPTRNDAYSADIGLHRNVAYGIQAHSPQSVNDVVRASEEGNKMHLHLHSNVAYMKQSRDEQSSPMTENTAYEAAGFAGEVIPVQDNVAYLQQQRGREGGAGEEEQGHEDREVAENPLTAGLRLDEWVHDAVVTFTEQASTPPSDGVLHTPPETPGGGLGTDAESDYLMAAEYSDYAVAAYSLHRGGSNIVDDEGDYVITSY